MLLLSSAGLYINAKDPDHIALNFPVTCEVCHDLAPGWKPASFKQHDASFPIFSGTHNGTWNSCTECHPNASSYSASLAFHVMNIIRLTWINDTEKKVVTHMTVPPVCIAIPTDHHMTNETYQYYIVAYLFLH